MSEYAETKLVVIRQLQNLSQEPLALSHTSQTTAWPRMSLAPRKNDIGPLDRPTDTKSKKLLIFSPKAISIIKYLSVYFIWVLTVLPYHKNSMN